MQWQSTKQVNILYNGAEKWTSSQSIADLFEDFELYVEIGLKAPFLINLGKEPNDKLKQEEAAAVPQLIMKGNIHKDYCNILPEIYPLIKKYEQDDEENIDYMATVDKHGEMKFLNKLSKFSPETTNHYKQMFELGIQRASQKALKKGIKEGIEKGSIKAS